MDLQDVGWERDMVYPGDVYDFSELVFSDGPLNICSEDVPHFLARCRVGGRDSEDYVFIKGSGFPCYGEGGSC